MGAPQGGAALVLRMGGRDRVLTREAFKATTLCIFVRASESEDASRRQAVRESYIGACTCTRVGFVHAEPGPPKQVLYHESVKACVRVCFFACVCVGYVREWLDHST